MSGDKFARPQGLVDEILWRIATAGEPSKAALPKAEGLQILRRDAPQDYQCLRRAAESVADYFVEFAWFCKFAKEIEGARNDGD